MVKDIFEDYKRH
jgi:phospholipid-transporting ATPase